MTSYSVLDYEGEVAFEDDCSGTESITHEFKDEKTTLTSELWKRKTFCVLKIGWESLGILVLKKILRN